MNKANTAKKYSPNGTTKNSGLGLVEMVIVVALIATAFTALFQFVLLERSTKSVAREELAAYTILREALEAVRGVRDAAYWDAFDDFALSTPFYPEVIGDQWQLSAENPGDIGIYTRWIAFNEVRRDGNDNVVESGGSVDTDSRRATSYVTWTTVGGNDRQIELETIVTNWQEFQ